jgi:hypothetical protein
MKLKVKLLQSKHVPLKPYLFRMYLIHAPYCFIMPCEMPTWKWVATSSKHAAISPYMLPRINTVRNDLRGQRHTQDLGGSETRILIRLLGCIFPGTGNSAQVCQNFGIWRGVNPPSSVRHCARSVFTNSERYFAAACWQQI